jgi:hypothetical protein
VEYIYIIGGNEVILESVDERGAKRAIRITNGLRNSRMDRLFCYMFSKFCISVESFIVSFVKFLLKVLFNFILKLIVSCFLNLILQNLSSSLYDGLTFRNLKKSSYHSITNGPFWITEHTLLYDMCSFFCAMTNLFWLKFNLKQLFLNGLPEILLIALIEQKMEFHFSSRKLIDNEGYNHANSFPQQVSAYYSNPLSFGSRHLFSKSNMSLNIDP